MKCVPKTSLFWNQYNRSKIEYHTVWYLHKLQGLGIWILQAPANILSSVLRRLFEFFYIQSTSVQYFEFTLRDQILGTDRYKLWHMVRLSGAAGRSSGSWPKSTQFKPYDCTIPHLYKLTLTALLFGVTNKPLFVSYSPDYKLERTLQISAGKTNPLNFAQQQAYLQHPPPGFSVSHRMIFEHVCQ